MQCYRNVLVVDDDDDVRDAVVGILRDDGYAVTTATNGAEALALLGHDALPCVVLLDLMMPVMTGWELVSRMRASEALGHVPVVVTCAAADRIPRGVDGILRKPISHDALTAVVGELCPVEPAPQRLANADVLRELTRRNIELAELQRFNDEMGALIVHDMNSPLCAISMNVRFVLDGGWPDSDPDRREALVDIQSATERLLRLVNNLLELVRLESGQFLPRRTSIAAGALLAPVFTRRKRMAADRGITLRISGVPDVSLQVDVDLMVRALDNLLDTAFRHAPAGGRIEVDVTTSNHALLLRIGNTGPAIPEASRPRLFEKFGGMSGHFRMNLGLGLYFCRLVLEAHGGSIALEETATLPMVFSLKLPL
jgi:two-component system, sensor histidine kinase and response regulator